VAAVKSSSSKSASHNTFKILGIYSKAKKNNELQDFKSEGERKRERKKTD